MKIQLISILLVAFLMAGGCINTDTVHVWEKVELVFYSQNDYNNPYTDVAIWVDLTGPGFNKKVHGFWDGDNIFKIRLLATHSGSWSWTVHSNVKDRGLNGKSGSFRAVEWTEQELAENPNRRGIIRPTANGHTLEYADGEPFFLLSDTHWAAATWRYPLKGSETSEENDQGKVMGFTDLIQNLDDNGFNSVAFITCFPNWDDDDYGERLVDDSGIQIRAAWRKPGTDNSGMDMHDENGNRAFMFPGKCNGKEDACADFDRINPEYWKSLDRKMDYMQDNGFVPYLESIRRDHLATWMEYHDFEISFTRFLMYIRARYNTNNFIYTLYHGDVVESYQDVMDPVFDSYYEKYGPMPFGQPTTVMSAWSSLEFFGTPEESPWLEMHTAGNYWRHHGIYPYIEALFNSKPPIPVFNNEPYYVGHTNYGTPKKSIAGEVPQRNSDRDNYFGRAQLYGSVFSGGLAGHVYGSLSWPGVASGEPAQPDSRYADHWWVPFSFPVFSQVQYIRDFIFSEGSDYRELTLTPESISPRKSKTAKEDGLDGWAYMMRTEDKKLGMLYFENECEIPEISDMIPETSYIAKWFNPRNGEWSEISGGILISDRDGTLQIPSFPSGNAISEKDWALKLSVPD